MVSAGAGRDPAAEARIKPFRHESGALVPLTEVLAFGGSYGVNVAVAVRAY